MKNNILITALILLLGGCHSAKQKTTFTWDFDTPKNYVYTFRQEIISKSNMMGMDMKEHVIADGNLLIKAKSNKMADLVIKDLTMKMPADSLNSMPGLPTNTPPQTMVIQDMTDSGGFKQAPTDNQILFLTLFPLPDKNLQVGQQDAIPIKVPFNAFGSQLFVTGNGVITFVKTETKNGHNCAVLDDKIDISKIDIPKDLKGNYSCSFIGDGTYYFDMDNHYFISADIKLKITMNLSGTDSTVMGMKMSGGMAMTSDNTYQVRFVKIDK